MKNIMKVNIGIFSLGVILLTGCTKTPTPCFSADNGSAAKVNEEVQFDPSCSKDATSYFWDFGDGTSTYGNPVMHKYANTGVYMVKLTASNSKKSASVIQNVAVNP